MENCPKCNFALKGGAGDQCPSCGVYFSKFFEHQEKLTIADNDNRKRNEARNKQMKSAYAFVGAAVLLGALYFGYLKFDEYRVETRRDQVNKSLSKMEAIHQRWSDASRLANSTSRIALSGPVERLQEIQRELENMPPVVSCLNNARQNLELAVAADVESFLLFMMDRNAESNRKSAELSRIRTSNAELYLKQVNRRPFVCDEYIARGGS